MKFFGNNSPNNSGGATRQIADRRDYVISNIGNELPISTVTQVDGLFSGGAVTPRQYNVSLDTDWPHVWFGFMIGSIYSTTPAVSVQPQDLLIQLLDSNRDQMFSSPLSVASIMTAVSSSNMPGGNNMNEPYVINPMKPQPAGGSIRIEAANLNTSGTLGFEIILMMWKVKENCLAQSAPGRRSPMRNLTPVMGVR